MPIQSGELIYIAWSLLAFGAGVIGVYAAIKYASPAEKHKQEQTAADFQMFCDFYLPKDKIELMEKSEKTFLEHKAQYEYAKYCMTKRIADFEFRADYILEKTIAVNKETHEVLIDAVQEIKELKEVLKLIDEGLSEHNKLIDQKNLQIWMIKKANEDVAFRKIAELKGFLPITPQEVKVIEETELPEAPEVQNEAEELIYKIKDTATTHLPHDWQFGFQTPNSPVMEGIIKFHDDLMIFLTFILFFVVYMIYACLEEFLNKSSISRAGMKLPTYSNFIHHPKLEIIWTILPALILVNLALPSFSLLYSIDEIVEPTFTFKTVGHQWYWSYEIMSGSELSETVLGSKSFNENDSQLKFEETSFDSYMLAEEDLIRVKENHRRLLTVDNHLPLPVAQNVRVLVTSADVLHSWAVPSLGVKLDACPGRLNQTWLIIDRAGFYYGQCSELCGVNHGFMPIGILALDVLGLNIPAALAEALFLIATREDS